METKTSLFSSKIIIYIVSFLLASLIVQLAWNQVVVDVWSVKTIDYGQAAFFYCASRLILNSNTPT